VELGEDGGGSRRQGWIETSGLWSMLELGAIRHKSGKPSHPVQRLNVAQHWMIACL